MTGLSVLVIGSGGREHALGWALARSASVREIASAPGNPGLASLGAVHAVAADDVVGLASLVRGGGFDLVVVGPEVPLALGLADRLRAEGVAVFGPGEAGARLESSKAFAKGFMERHGIPTAAYRRVERMADVEETLSAWGAPVVVKASGLAAGKGVTVAETVDEARRAAQDSLEANAYGDAGSTVVLEKKLEGEEVSLFVLTDGRRYHLLPSAQDHKRAYDGDAGPNTGGMGAYSPAPALDPELLALVEETMVRRTLAGLAAEGIPYRGLLYLGLMLTPDGPRVLEYNVRFGDPETQAVLPRLGWDLGSVLLAAARGELGEDPLPAPAHAAAACVVAAAGDYPRSGSRGAPIAGLDDAERAGALVFHAGTARRDGGIVTAGGRVLNLVGVGDDLRSAVETAYRGIAAVGFDGMRYRRDIAARALVGVGDRTGTGKGDGS
jgi:phosphoribosylamine--glycine ligase